MNVSQGKILTGIAAGVAAAMISAGAWSQPVTVNPGDNNLTIPTYTGPVPTFVCVVRVGSDRNPGRYGPYRHHPGADQF